MLITNKNEGQKEYNDNVNLLSVKVNIHPNPNNGLFVLDLNQKVQELSVQLYSINGALIYDKKYNEESLNKVQIDITSQSKGVYFIKVKSGDYMVTKKIIKK